jgi:hypothetical protein
MQTDVNPSEQPRAGLKQMVAASVLVAACTLWLTPPCGWRTNE